MLASYRRWVAPGLLILAPVAAFPASPEPTAAVSDADVSALPPVQATANRLAQTVDETLSPVTVITRAEIEQSQANTLFDLLRGQVGVGVNSSGGPGHPMSIFLRGTNSDQVLVLVDGVKIGSATVGAAAFQDIPPELVDRIEIVRGPRSSLYGSEAVGGVIQIFTRKGSSDFSPTLMAGIGSYGTSQGSASLSGHFAGNGWYSTGLSGFDTSGIPACQGNQNTTGCPAVTTPTANDGYHNQSGRLRAGWRFDNGLEAEVNLLHTHGAAQYVSSYSDQGRTEQNLLSTSLSGNVRDDWHSLLRLSQSRDNSGDYLDGTFVDQFNTSRNLMTWQNDFKLAPGNTLTAGVDQQNDRIDSSAAFPVNGRDNTGLFMQYLGKWGAQDLEVSARRDIDAQFGTATTGSAAWGYSWSERLRWATSYGTAFRMPTFNQLYYPYYGNPNLRPERSRSLDSGLSGRVGLSDWSVHAFETHLSDLIDTGPAFTAINIDSALIRGLESTFSTHWSQWSLRSSVDLLDPTNRTPGALYGTLLPERAPQSARIDFDRNLGAWSTGTTVRAESARKDFAYLAPNYGQQIVGMGGFVTVDLRSEYRIDRSWHVQARVENLLNKNYETAYPYNQLGRGAYLTLRWQP